MKSTHQRKQAQLAHAAGLGEGWGNPADRAAQRRAGEGEKRLGHPDLASMQPAWLPCRAQRPAATGAQSLRGPGMAVPASSSVPGSWHPPPSTQPHCAPARYGPTGRPRSSLSMQPSSLKLPRAAASGGTAPAWHSSKRSEVRPGAWETSGPSQSSAPPQAFRCREARRDRWEQPRTSSGVSQPAYLCGSQGWYGQAMSSRTAGQQRSRHAGDRHESPRHERGGPPGSRAGALQCSALVRFKVRASRAGTPGGCSAASSCDSDAPRARG